MRIAECDRCKRLVWVNTTTRGGEFLGEYCAECFDHVYHDYPCRNRTGGHSGTNHNDPGFDNVIRALEEDR